MWLVLEGVAKTFYPGTPLERPALRNISLTLAEGEFAVVIGSNGAGKSTLLNVIAGTHRPDRGKIFLDGEEITRAPEHVRARAIARVFQDPLQGTAPSLTIAENLAVALRRGERRGLRVSTGPKERERFREALRILGMGLEDRLDARVGTLSGGERQALSLLMATFTRPKLLLLDEHTAALDPKRARDITALTEKLVREWHLTTLMVTHNMEQAIAMGDRLLMMHEGEIVLDISGEKKRGLTVPDLIAAFERVRGEKFAEDRALL
ncbi:MAG: ATP-binding cassette domain-containing protein [Brockia lithotrophica]|nr:ATP-binding cassette domain-containing protein [Brockia lithotrophica]